MTQAAVVTELILECFRFNGRLLAAGDALVKDLDLTSARWQVLGAIALSSGPLTVSQIARTMGLSRQAVQRVANELEASEYIRFKPNPRHQRAKLAMLSPRGKALFDAASRRQEPWAAALGEGVTANDIEAATRLLRILRHRLEAASSPVRLDEP